MSLSAIKYFIVYRKTLGLATLLLMASIMLPGVASAKGMTLNFKDADITAFITTVSELTGKNFIVDPRVKGKVTIISSTPMNSKEVYQVFLSVLEVHGFAAVRSGEVFKIIPNASAKQDALPFASERSPGRGDEIVTRVIELDNVSASQLVPILRPLVPQQGHLAAYVPGNTLIISDRAANIARLLKIIKRIDTPISEEVEMISLQHASAVEVVRILSSMEQKGKSKQRQADAAMMIADERTNSILLGGGRSKRLKMRTIISHLDSPLETEGNTRVIYLRYARAKDLVSVLTGVSSSVAQQKQKLKGAAAASSSRVSIQAVESTNTLVITAPLDMFRTLDVVIKKLDIRRAQVLVETIIAEVSENLSTELGVQWLVDGTPSGSGPIALSNFGGATTGSISGLAGSLALGGIPSFGNGLTLGAGVFNSASVNFAGLLTALKGDGMTNILSTPSLVTLDNEEAEIVVGQTVPFVTGSFSSTGSGGSVTNPFQTIKRENVGITLKVKPQINEGNAIRLDLYQTVDSLSASSSGAADLITNTRSIKTSVIVDDGHLVVLGGLIDDSTKESSQKVPLLGDIPLIGALFRYKTTTNDKTNLMVFMRPTIIRDASLANQLSGSKYNYIREQQLKARGRGLLLMSNKRSPVLPEFDDLLAIPPVAVPADVSGQDGNE